MRVELPSIAPTMLHGQPWYCLSFDFLTQEINNIVCLTLKRLLRVNVFISSTV